jgi:hypothetical protein
MLFHHCFSTILWNAPLRQLKETMKDGNMLRIFERRILTGMYGPITENFIWGSRYNHELCKLYDEPRIVKVVKVGL